MEGRRRSIDELTKLARAGGGRGISMGGWRMRGEEEI